MLSADGSTGFGSARNAKGLSHYVRYGRLRHHRPFESTLVAPWGWGWRTQVLMQGQQLQWTVGDSGQESSSIAQGKWAFLWFDSNLQSTSNIVIQVVDTCPQGGGEALVAWDYSHGLRKAIRLSQADISGKCLEMRAIALSTPFGGTRFWSADYFHSGPTEVH